jgi:hypothetical protein
MGCKNARNERGIALNNENIGEKTFFVHEGESTFVPKTTLHRLSNPGKVPLEIIEVQDGSYLVEFLLSKGCEVHGVKRRAARTILPASLISTRVCTMLIPISSCTMAT